MTRLRVATVATTTPLTVRERATGQTVPAKVIGGSSYTPATGDRVVVGVFTSNRYTILGSV